MKSFLTAFLLGFVAMAKAQPTEPFTIYGFKQSVSPGLKNAGAIDERGRFIKNETPPMANVYLYAVKNGTAPAQIFEVWVKGQPFSATVDTLQTPPTVQPNGITPASIASPLFPVTGNLILQIQPVPLNEKAADETARQHAAHNEIVVVFEAGGRRGYGVLKKLRALPRSVRP